MDVSKVTRVEMIRPGWGQVAKTQFVESIELSLQDDGRTLKVFLGPESPEAQRLWREEFAKDLQAILREDDDIIPS